MDILLISLLILFGILFCVVELLVLPGVSVGGILAALCDGWAIYLAFAKLGRVEGFVVIAIIVMLTCVAVAISLRSKTWERLALKSELNSVSASSARDVLKVGDRGTAISRLSPMGKVEIGGNSYEAKSVDIYIDAKSEVEVVGFENFNVVVKRVE